MEDVYIGTKIVAAEPMDSVAFAGWQGRPGELPARPGYKVRYEDGYTSWSPKDVFERCYRKVTANERVVVLAAVDIDPTKMGLHSDVMHITQVGDPAERSTDPGKEA